MNRYTHKQTAHDIPALLGILCIALFMCMTLYVDKSYAEPLRQHALAMYDEPLYPAGFTSYDYVNPDAPKGGRLRRAEIGTFDNLNPFLITGRITGGLQEALLLTYDSLMVRAWNEPFTMYGQVAESIRIPQKRNWIEFHLDKTARFHDGHPITAEDVAFSHKVLMQYGRPNQRRIYKLVKVIDIITPHRVRFVFGEGYDRETALILSGMPVIPKHYWQDKEFGKTTLVPPLGSGPYRIRNLEAGKRIVFERVADYWAKDKAISRGLYNFDTLEYDYFRDDKVAMQALGVGQIDLRREWSAVAWEREYDIKAVQEGALKKSVFQNGRPTRARFLIYNMRRKPFDDIRVREALAYAFDFEWLNKNLFYGTQKRINSLFMNSELADQSADRFVPPNTQQNGLRDNLKHAIALMDEAGWHLQDGVLRSKATDQEFAFEILLNDPNDEKVALAYARTLKKIGVTARIRTVDTAQYIGRMSQFDFDMTGHFWRNSLSPGTEQAVYWHSQAADQGGSFNYVGLKSAEVDDLIGVLTTAKNRETLVKTAQKLDHIIMKQWIGVPLYDAPEDRVAHHQDIHYPKITPLYGPVIESWWQDGPKSGKDVSNDLSPQ